MYPSVTIYIDRDSLYVSSAGYNPLSVGCCCGWVDGWMSLTVHMSNLHPSKKPFPQLTPHYCISLRISKLQCTLSVSQNLKKLAIWCHVSTMVLRGLKIKCTWGLSVLSVCFPVKWSLFVSQVGWIWIMMLLWYIVKSCLHNFSLCTLCLKINTDLGHCHITKTHPYPYPYRNFFLKIVNCINFHVKPV